MSLHYLDKSSAVAAEMGDRLATIDTDRKLRGLLCPFPWGGAGSPSNTMSHPGLSPYQMTSGSIQPFGHNTPTSHAGQTGQTRESCSIGRTVTCNVRPKNGDKRPSPNPKVEIWRKPHKRARSTRLPIRLSYNIWT